MLSAVPNKLLVMGAAAAVAVVLVLAGVQTLRLAAEQTAHAETRREHAEKLVKLERAAREAEQAARREEQRRAAALQEVVDETEKDLARARVDAAAATAAGDRLRGRLAEFTAGCRRPAGDPVAAGAGAPAASAEDLLAHVQRRLDDATDSIARFADQAAAAGRACERSYDALTR